MKEYAVGKRYINKDILTVITPLIHEVNKRNPELHCGTLQVGTAIEKLPYLCDCVLNATERIASVVGNLKKFGRKDITKYTGQVNVNNTVLNAVQLTKRRINELAVLGRQGFIGKGTRNGDRAGDCQSDFKRV